jgi:hypothetical protein
MPSCGPDPGARLVAAACFRAVRQRLAYVGGQEHTLAALSGFRRETRLQLHARDRHPVADGPWCTGPAQVTDADTTARPRITHNHGGAYESLSLPHTGPTLHGSRRLG